MEAHTFQQADDDKYDEVNDQEGTDSSGEEENKSVYITTPPKFAKKAINIRKFK